MFTWREILCDGPSTYKIDSSKFIDLRSCFLQLQYDIPVGYYEEKFSNQFEMLKDLSGYDEINIWFEYDLFCHINMIAAISLLHQMGNDLPIYSICSGRVAGEDHLKGLSELSKGQLLDHFENKILLKDSDIKLADSLWQIYCSDMHHQFHKYVTQPSSFKYLSNCLSAHLKRFPSKHSGLNLIEVHLLNLITQHQIKSKHHLLGYLLQYQGYYGYGDSQLEKIIDKMDSFFEAEDDFLVLNEDGEKALAKEANFYDKLKDDTIFGGISKYRFVYDINSRTIEKV
ncbi:DUF1835 domain-containing protein [Spongiivirga citrea]|uniref:DUF1835 domain-containing protein n=1 Tax=Spongiivirga citrea TaxID=1481457 RepID=A0A6M0CFG6_9FLAO|nr:DUF1835 domain-containing protein [Spongiivirga citrea]NER15633.1 DUF1835 domain-containing protein [Spongiivirga citrea]